MLFQSCIQSLTREFVSDGGLIYPAKLNIRILIAING